MPKTIAEKLQIKSGNLVHVLGATEEELELLEPLPEGAEITTQLEGPVTDSIILFAKNKEHLEEMFVPNQDHFLKTRAAWIAYPKGNKSDINRDSIWRYLEEIEWTLNSNVAIDDKWSAVRFKKMTD